MPILPDVNPDAEKWNELAGYDLVTAEAMLAPDDICTCSFVASRPSKND